MLPAYEDRHKQQMLEMQGPDLAGEALERYSNAHLQNTPGADQRD